MDFPEFSLDVAALKTTTEPEPDTVYDLLILGGGPASMSAAVYGARKLLKLAILTKDFGGQMLETSEVENWLGAQSIRARELVSQFEEHVKSFEIPALIGHAVTGLERSGDLFKVSLDNGKVYQGRTVLLTTGMRHRALNAPGEQEFKGKGVAYCATCDAPFYKNKKVVVVGGGNSAFTTALDLVKVGARVHLVNYKKGWQADETLRERLKKADHVTLIDHAEVARIDGKEKVEQVSVKDLKTGKVKKVPADGIFIEIGLLPNTEFLKGVVELNDRGEVLVDCACQTSVEGVFAAGDVTTVPHKQIVISAGEGAKAALTAYDYLIRKNLI